MLKIEIALNTAATMLFPNLPLSKARKRLKTETDKIFFTLQTLIETEDNKKNLGNQHRE